MSEFVGDMFTPFGPTPAPLVLMISKLFFFVFFATVPFALGKFTSEPFIEYKAILITQVNNKANV